MEIFDSHKPSAKKQQTKTSRKRKMLSVENIKKPKRKPCCKNNCLKNILTIHDVMEARSEFWEKNREEQGQWLLNFFSFGRKIKNGRSCLQYIINKDVGRCQFDATKRFKSLHLFWQAVSNILNPFFGSYKFLQYLLWNSLRIFAAITCHFFKEDFHLHSFLWYSWLLQLSLGLWAGLCVKRGNDFRSVYLW